MKKTILMLAFLLAAAAISPAETQQAPTDGLVGYWSFDKIENGKVKDLSGNGHDGTVIDASFTDKGRINGCLQFSGEKSRVNCGPAKEFGISDAITAAVWVWPEPDHNRNRFVTFLKDRDGFGIGNEAGLERFAWWFENSKTQENYGFYCNVWAPPSKWSHLAITYANGEIKAYHNGVLIGREGWFKGSIGVPDTDVLLGSDGYWTLKGLLDEVRIYNRALSDDEIKQLANALPEIPVQKVSLSETNLSLAMGSTAQLDYAIEPWHARNQQVIWNSSDPTVAAVSDRGVIDALGAGTTTVTATAANGRLTAACTVEVHKQPVTAVQLEADAARIEEGRSQQFQATVQPSDATVKEVIWQTSAPAVATVDADGRVHGRKSGTANITASAVDNGKSATCAVTVWKTPVAGITLNKHETTIAAGHFEKLVPTVAPEDASWKSIIRWQSSDPAVATVDQAGVVIAVGQGQAKITAETRDGHLTDSCSVTVPAFGSGRWSKTIILRDNLRGYLWAVSSLQMWISQKMITDDYVDALDFPEQLLHYRLDFPPNTVRRNGLKLTTADDDLLEYQLSDVKTANDFLTSATISFRSNLATGQIKGFIVDYDPGYDAKAAAPQNITVTPNGSTAIIAANKQQIKVPFGTIAYDGGELAGQVPGPIIATARNGQTWCGAGSLQIPKTIKVTGITGTVLEHGPLYLKYREIYTFTGGRTYTVELTVQHNEQFVTVDEYIDGFAPEDDAWLRYSVQEGIEPDGRLVEANSSYRLTTYRGRFDHNLKPNGRFPYELGIYTPNSYGVNHGTVFWKDDGQNAIVFAVNRPSDWRMAHYPVWRGFSPHNLAFYCRNNGRQKYMTTQLEGTERHWALGIIPRSEVKLYGKPSTRDAGKSWLVNKDFIDFPGFNDVAYYYRWTYGPEVQLYDRLTEHNLDWIKDLALNWDNGQFLDLPQEPPMTAEKYLTIRARRAFNVYVFAGDTRMPHISMMAGQPNFVIHGKTGLAVGAGEFPQHPDAQQWKNEYINFFHQWLDTYVRKDDPAHNTYGGRETENIACYSIYSLEAALNAARNLRSYDGTDLLDVQMFRDWMWWYLYCLMPTENGIFLVPPQGAHAAAGIPPKNIPHGASRYYRDYLCETARWIRDQGKEPDLGNTLLWALTRGTEEQAGKKEITLQSRLFTDYGAVLWYDYGGPHEAYVNIQQLSGPSYRWSDANNGMIYYCSKGRRWSWNGDEETGDQFNIKQLTVFNVNGKGLAGHSVDGVLYDFGPMQYYCARGSNRPYLSRGVMMLRDDYLSVYDDVEGDATGTFQWKGGYPEIYPIKTGPGDNLHIVAPQKLTVTPRPYGAVVNGNEYVFMQDANATVSDGPAEFTGSVGYARENELAIFKGTSLHLGSFAIARKGGDFGFSAVASDKSITGKIAGRKGGTITITPPEDFDLKNAIVTIMGEKVDSQVNNGSISFPVSISVPDGCKTYTITIR